MCPQPRDVGRCIADRLVMFLVSFTQKERYMQSISARF
jgi:hypothetical protein